MFEQASRWTIRLLAALWLSTSAIAATDSTDSQAAAYEAKLQTALSKFSALAGRWQVLNQMHDPERGWFEAERAELRFDWALGGRLLETRGHMQNADFRLSISYDAMKSVYRLALIDSASGVLDVYEGDFDDQQTLIVTNPDDFQWRIRQQDGGWSLDFYQSTDQGSSWKALSRNRFTPAS